MKPNHVMRKMILFIIAGCIASLLSGGVCATDFYADIIIDVTDSGFVSITGTTNHPEFLFQQTDIFTSKTDQTWTLNITKEEVFSEYYFSLNFPEGTSIYSVVSHGTIWIEEEAGHLMVNGFGENRSFLLLIKYQLTHDSASLPLHIILNILFISLIFATLSLIVWHVYHIRKKKMLSPEETKKDISGLTERQKAILHLLQSSKVPLTQTEIEKQLSIPKASVSRNIRSMQRKGLLDIEKVGMSNCIKVKK